MIALRTVPVTCQAQKSIVFCRAHWSFGCPVPVPTSGGRRLVTVALNAVAACTYRPRWRVCACAWAWPAVSVSLSPSTSLGFPGGPDDVDTGQACHIPPTRTASPIHPSPPRAPCLPVRRFLQPRAVLACPARQSSTYPARSPRDRWSQGSRPVERRKTIRHPHVCSPRTPWPLATGQIDSLGRTH